MNDKKDIIEAGWNFDNSYSLLPKLFFKTQKPVQINSPKLIILNHSLAQHLGLNIQTLKTSDGVAVFAGNRIPIGSLPLAQAYAGHQFGHFTMLGDGRAVLIGEQITPLNERYDIQLKGSGRTPFSRGGDGRAPLGPMLREYIISEAMHGLGIPTTRSLAVVSTGEHVYRDTILPGAILTRIASSHIRVGTFQYASAWASVEDLKILADYTLNRHFNKHDSVKNPYLYLLNEVINRQAILIAKWQLVGFIHGVMNTDNMSLCGETIDYGPCAFMDKYDINTVFSSIDHQGRYAYGNQPNIATWNLARFAESLIPLLHEDKEKALQIAQDALSKFTVLYDEYWLSGMKAKLGLFGHEEYDKSLFEKLLSIMQKNGSDYTNTFRSLTLNKLSNDDLFDTEAFLNWQKLWQSRLERQKESSSSSYELMRESNPSIIPRNHRVEEAIKAAVKNNDYSIMENLLDVLLKPYVYSKEQEEYSTLPNSSSTSYKTFCGT
jgi:uncharacterized protein YdiU (UPF0061 family)